MSDADKTTKPLTPGWATWGQLRALEAEIEKIDAARALMIEKKRHLESEVRRLGQMEGWHV